MRPPFHAPSQEDLALPSSSVDAANQFGWDPRSASMPNVSIGDYAAEATPHQSADRVVHLIPLPVKPPKKARKFFDLIGGKKAPEPTTSECVITDPLPANTPEKARRFFGIDDKIWPGSTARAFLPEPAPKTPKKRRRVNTPLQPGWVYPPTPPLPASRSRAHRAVDEDSVVPFVLDPLPANTPQKPRRFFVVDDKQSPSIIASGSTPHRAVDKDRVVPFVSDPLPADTPDKARRFFGIDDKKPPATPASSSKPLRSTLKFFGSNEDKKYPSTPASGSTPGPSVEKHVSFDPFTVDRPPKGRGIFNLRKSKETSPFTSTGRRAKGKNKADPFISTPIPDIDNTPEKALRTLGITQSIKSPISTRPSAPTSVARPPACLRNREPTYEDPFPMLVAYRSQSTGVRDIEEVEQRDHLHDEIQEALRELYRHRKPGETATDIARRVLADLNFQLEVAMVRGKYQWFVDPCRFVPEGYAVALGNAFFERVEMLGL